MERWQKTKALIVGKGTIGTALGKLISEAGFEVDYHDPPKKIYMSCFPDVIHVCFPFKEQCAFIQHILSYLEILQNIKALIIESTIPLGIAPEIQKQFPNVLILHSPVRGTHYQMLKDLKKFPKIIGPADPSKFKEMLIFIENYYGKIFKPTTPFLSSEEAALGKLMSVNWYGLNIAFVQEFKLICEMHNVDFEQAYTQITMDDEIGHIYKKNKKGIIRPDKRIPRPVFIPEYVGGNCVRQDLELTKSIAFNQKWVEFCEESNACFKDKPVRIGFITIKNEQECIRGWAKTMLYFCEEVKALIDPMTTDNTRKILYEEFPEIEVLLQDRSLGDSDDTLKGSKQEMIYHGNLTKYINELVEDDEWYFMLSADERWQIKDLPKIKHFVAKTIAQNKVDGVWFPIYTMYPDYNHAIDFSKYKVIQVRFFKKFEYTIKNLKPHSGWGAGWPKNNLMCGCPIYHYSWIRSDNSVETNWRYGESKISEFKSFPVFEIENELKDWGDMPEMNNRGEITK